MSVVMKLRRTRTTSPLRKTARRKHLATLVSLGYATRLGCATLVRLWGNTPHSLGEEASSSYDDRDLNLLQHTVQRNVLFFTTYRFLHQHSEHTVVVFPNVFLVSILFNC